MFTAASQRLHPPIKEEECEGKLKLDELLHGINSTPKNKLSETRPIQPRPIQPQPFQPYFIQPQSIQHWLVQTQSIRPWAIQPQPIQSQAIGLLFEDTIINEPVSSSSRLLPLVKPRTTHQQIANLITYLVNDKMSVDAAARRAGMHREVAQGFYQKYLDDPEHRIPLPKPVPRNPLSKVTQKKIEKMIHHIVQDKMTLNQAADKLNIYRITAQKYYTRYLEDPLRKIPILDTTLAKQYTQEQVKELINYIVNNKMSMTAASKKVNMSINAAKIYYLRYLEDPNHEIPVPEKYTRHSGVRYTKEHVKTLIDCIAKEGMGIIEASVKAKMGACSARKYYKQYLEDPNHTVPTPATHTSNRHPGAYNNLDQVKTFFNSIIVDELDIKQASLKAKISNRAGRYYYQKYLKNPVHQVKGVSALYSLEKMKKIVSYIENDKMTLKMAASKADLKYTIARKYYRQYLKDPQHRIPTIKHQHHTQKDIQRFIGYIENNNMNVTSAARKAKMDILFAKKYYTKYQEDPEHKIPVPIHRGYTLNQKTIDKYSKIIADIYKNNPSIKPIDGSHQSNFDSPAIDIKQESLEEDTKMILKEGK